MQNSINVSSNPMMATVLRLSEKCSTSTLPAEEETSVSTLLAIMDLLKNIPFGLGELRKVKHKLSSVLSWRNICKFERNSRKFSMQCVVKSMFLHFLYLNIIFLVIQLFKSDCLWTYQSVILFGGKFLYMIPLNTPLLITPTLA